VTARSFGASPNALFEARVAAVRAPSPGFVRLTVAGPQLAHFAAHGRDQRIKLLLPGEGYPPAFDPGPEPVPETEWRARWRGLSQADRPVLRSYTPSAVRPARREVDLDVFVHPRPGPASAWAASARPGGRVLLSGPDARRGRPAHGVQWEPGAATSVLLAGDEAAVPAMRGILAALRPAVRARVVVEVADPADALLGTPRDGVTTTVCVRGERSLESVVGEWAGERGSYAWIAAESVRTARIRDALRGTAPGRVQAQGYWTDR
jgi:NADPH-dependent ferric siderophore reductase